MHSLTSFADGIFDAALALVYPQPCAICGRNVEARDDGVTCRPCWEATRLFDAGETLCRKCGCLSPVSLTANQRKDFHCGRCLDDEFTVARACGAYEGGLRASILELKRRPHVPRHLVNLIHELQQREPLNSAELIVPVPLHQERERQRGFNQATVLARALAHASQLPIDEQSVIRTLRTERHRAGMDAKARRASVAKAFVVKRNASIVGRRVLLIDDVYTTGATVSACAKALSEAGALEVLVLTVARV